MKRYKVTLVCLDEVIEPIPAEPGQPERFGRSPLSYPHDSLR